MSSPQPKRAARRPGKRKPSKKSAGRSPNPGRKRSARQAALQALFAVEKGKSERLRTALDVRGLEEREVSLAWELAQGTERNHLFLDFVLAQFVDRGLPKDPLLRACLRLGAYQLLFCSRIPGHAAVHETIGLLRDKRGFANAVLRRVAERVQDGGADPRRPGVEIPLPEGPEGDRRLVFETTPFAEFGSATFLAQRYGMPQFLVERWVEQLGYAEAEMACTAAGLPSPIVLRPTPRASVDQLVTALEEAGVVTSATGCDELLVVESGYPFGTEAFREGWFIAQDPTAYRAAKAVDAQPGESILDLCAAPGTKTTVLAEGVGETGRVYAFDIDVPRRRHIEQNFERLRLSGWASILESTDALAPMDRVLVDVPCSNSGVLSRRVEVRRRLRTETFTQLATVQRELLTVALDHCRPGGTVVYSTCSIDAEENRQVVDAVLAGRQDWSLQEDCLSLPEPYGCDGGYYAVLVATP